MTTPHHPKPRACMTLDELKVGMTFSKQYTVTHKMLEIFAELSGDYNPAHFNEEYALKTRFRERIAHGMISVAQFSGIFGMDMPGLGAIWGSQTANFMAPVSLGKPYTATATVKEIKEKCAIFTAECKDADGNVVMTGEGTLYPIPQKVKDGLGAELTDLLDTSSKASCAA